MTCGNTDTFWRCGPRPLLLLPARHPRWMPNVTPDEYGTSDCARPNPSPMFTVTLTRTAAGPDGALTCLPKNWCPVTDSYSPGPRGLRYPPIRTARGSSPNWVFASQNWLFGVDGGAGALRLTLPGSLLAGCELGACCAAIERLASCQSRGQIDRAAHGLTRKKGLTATAWIRISSPAPPAASCCLFAD